MQTAIFNPKKRKREHNPNHGCLDYITQGKLLKKFRQNEDQCD
jgi:hypothetical protein